MSDERIERLTEMARRVWPDEPDVRLLPASGGWFVASRDWRLLHVPAHPRALDALEAALLVLAGEAPLVAAGQGAVCRLVTPAWVEQLASEYARRAAEIRDACTDPKTGTLCATPDENGLIFTLEGIAAELRARAKGADT